MNKLSAAEAQFMQQTQQAQSDYLRRVRELMEEKHVEQISAPDEDEFPYDPESELVYETILGEEITEEAVTGAFRLVIEFFQDANIPLNVIGNRALDVLETFGYGGEEWDIISLAELRRQNAVRPIWDYPHESRRDKRS